MNRIISMTPVIQLVKPTYVINKWNSLRKRYLCHPCFVYKLVDISMKAIVE